MVALVEVGRAPSAPDRRLPARPPWSARRWAFLRGRGPELPVHRGATKPPPSHRLLPHDRSRYPGWRLREIRARAKNFLRREAAMTTSVRRLRQLLAPARLEEFRARDRERFRRELAAGPEYDRARANILASLAGYDPAWAGRFADALLGAALTD